MGGMLRFGMMLMVSGLPALASEFLEERAKCNRDNLLRCYNPTGTKPTDVASRSAATAFCSSYLSIPVVTSVMTTITPVTTVTSVTATTDSTKVVTSVFTTVSTQVLTVVTTVPALAPPAAKRDAVAPVTGPRCAGTTYQPSSVSSACSCLSVTPSTTYITATAATSTNIILSTIHDTSTTETAITTTETSTSTVTSTSTSSSPTSTTTSAPPSLQTCAFGVAFGYQNPVGGSPKSFTLNTQSGQGCNRWGWYETPTLAELQGGISGPLYVGAGGNDITQAIEVGIWVATANALGGVTVTYLLNPPYGLAEVHVNLVCLPLANCAPAAYTYNAGSIPNLPTWSNPTPLAYPTCSGGSRAALVVEASVNDLTVTSTCPPLQAA